ncbi:MAG: hypothetical protein KTR31_24110 [Myxococcales bacterium]|nr:hypothetical protein [Myxococcales bacterium]
MTQQGDEGRDSQAWQAVDRWLDDFAEARPFDEAMLPTEVSPSRSTSGAYWAALTMAAAAAVVWVVWPTVTSKRGTSRTAGVPEVVSERAEPADVGLRMGWLASVDRPGLSAVESMDPSVVTASLREPGWATLMARDSPGRTSVVLTHDGGREVVRVEVAEDALRPSPYWVRVQPPEMILLLGTGQSTELALPQAPVEVEVEVPEILEVRAMPSTELLELRAVAAGSTHLTVSYTRHFRENYWVVVEP